MIATADNVECGIFLLKRHRTTHFSKEFKVRQGWVLLSFSPSRLKKPQYKTCYVCCEKCRSENLLISILKLTSSYKYPKIDIKIYLYIFFIL